LVLTGSIKVKDSQALVLDAGHISVESNLVNKEQLKELQSKRGKQYDEDDFKQLEDLMYDKFSLQLEATQVSSI
jgi:vacuolar protein sorting-associated protein 13A/C